MKKVNVTINASHPIHQLLDELNLSLIEWIDGVRSTEVPKMFRAISRAMGAIKIAGTGQRPEYHAGSAVASLIWIETGFRVLFQRKLISAEIFELATRRLNRLLKAIELLSAAGSENWPDVELPPLQNPPDVLAEDATIKQIRLLRVRIAEETRALRVRKQEPDTDPNEPIKDAA
jgi:hypothetical protein